MRSPATILVTGGIGSGKSYVVNIMRHMGVPSYDCDSRARSLYDEYPSLAEAVSDAVGGGVIGDDGRIDRKALSAKIFSDGSLLLAVEALVHPVLMEDFSQWRLGQDAPAVVVESATMLEKPTFRDIYDKVVAVCAPEDVRIARAVYRDSSTEEAVRSRMACQWSDAQRSAAADYIVNNDGKQALLPQIMEILRNYGKD